MPDNFQTQTLWKTKKRRKNPIRLSIAILCESHLGTRCKNSKLDQYVEAIVTALKYLESKGFRNKVYFYLNEATKVTVLLLPATCVYVCVFIHTWYIHIHTYILAVKHNTNNCGWPYIHTCTCIHVHNRFFYSHTILITLQMHMCSSYIHACAYRYIPDWL